GVLAEVLHSDVAGRGVDHEIRRYGRYVDLVARELELQQLVVAAAAHTDVDGRSFGAAERALRLLDGPALCVLTRDVGEHVAAPDALLVGRRSFEDVHRRHVAVVDLNRHADAVVAAFLALAHLRIFTWREITGVRIERAE